MGKPERKSRERICSSSSYFLRCFGISRKLYSNKPIVDAGQETQNKNKKKTTKRTCWFLRPTNICLKNGGVTPALIYEKEKPKSIVKDDKQNLFRVISNVTDRKNIADSGYKAVEHESNEKDTNEQRDINPDPLSFSGYDMCHQRVRGGKPDDPIKTVGSGTKPKDVREKSSRVRKGSRVRRFDPVIGISIIMLTLMIMLIWGRFCAILCTSTWCYFLPRLKESATAVAAAKRKRSCYGKNGEDGSLPSDLDLNSVAYKKKVVLEGFLFRQHRV